jgi:hypothetical protein
MNSKQPTQVRGSYFPFEATASDAERRIADAVMQRIAARRLAKARTAASLYGFTAILGVGILIPALSYTASLAQESGFTSYLSLVASDGTSVISYWKPFVLSVVESAPIVGSALVLVALLVLGYSLMRLVSDITTIKSHRHAIL